MSAQTGGEGRPFVIRGRLIDASQPLFVVAEIGLNHGGVVDQALALTEAASAAGASAVKLQTIHAEALVAPGCPPPAHVGAGSMREFFARFELDEASHARVAARAHELGLAFLSTPFDEGAVDLLVRVGADALKIASGDLTHRRLIARAASTGLPLVLSTGMSEEHEVAAAVAWAREHGASGIALLHCVSAYPVPAGSENLGAIRALATRFSVPVGLSDHGGTAESVPLAVALGASIYERHVVMPGDSSAIDRPVSSTPDELTVLVRAAARTQQAVGHGRRTCLAVEAGNRLPSRRGIYARRLLSAGVAVRADDLVCLRPAGQIGAEAWNEVVGRRPRQSIPAGHPLKWDDLESGEDA